MEQADDRDGMTAGAKWPAAKYEAYEWKGKEDAFRASSYCPV
jgi:hypothetical protein